MTDPVELEALKQTVIKVLKGIKDPEIPVNIYDLGLVYEVEVAAFGVVNVRMTLTAPACPVADSIVAEVQGKISELPEVSGCYVDLVWDPPWDKTKMTLAARLELNLL